MSTGNKPAISGPICGPHGEALAGAALEDALRALAFTNPDIVEVRGALPAVLEFAAGPEPARGARQRYDELAWPAARARAVAILEARRRPASQRVSQRAIAEVLGLSERTVRTYDQRERRRRLRP